MTRDFDTPRPPLMTPLRRLVTACLHLDVGIGVHNERAGRQSPIRGPLVDDFRTALHEAERALWAADKLQRAAMDPTAYGDMEADALRTYYEAHRETWWRRFWRRGDQADELMLGMIQALDRFRRDHPNDRSSTDD